LFLDIVSDIRDSKERGKEENGAGYSGSERLVTLVDISPIQSYELPAGGAKPLKVADSSVLREPSFTNEGGVHVPKPNPSRGTLLKEHPSKME